jgi:general secretion pathway protein J
VRTHRHRGFTLLEVLMALVLLAVLLTGALSGIQAARKAMDSGERAIDRVNRMRVAQEFVRHEISRTLPLAFGHDKTTGTNFVFQGENDFLRFVAPMPGYLSRGGAYVQSLELARGQHGLQLLFTHHLLNGFDLDNLGTDKIEPVLLLDGIRAGRFEYRTYDDKGELGDWTRDWKDPARTPLMVRLALEMQPEAHLDWPLMDIPLLLDAGAAGFNPAAGFIPQPQPQQPQAEVVK